MEKRRRTHELAISAMIAALYVALTLGLGPISFMAVQFRVSEVLNLMAFINPMYGIGVTVGCLISNMFSGLGPIDLVIGTASTAIAVFFISKTRNLFVASLWPVLFSGVMVGWEITYVFQAATPLLLNIASVALGEFAVVTCVGYPLFRWYILRNKKVYSLLKNR